MEPKANLYSEAFSAAHELLTPDPESPMVKDKPYNAYSVEFDPELLAQVNLYVPANAGRFVTLHARADRRLEVTNEVKEPIPPAILLEGDRVVADPFGDASNLLTLNRSYYLSQLPRMSTVTDYATGPRANPLEDGEDDIRPLSRDEGVFATAALIAIVKHFRPLDS